MHTRSAANAAGLAFVSSVLVGLSLIGCSKKEPAPAPIPQATTAAPAGPDTAATAAAPSGGMESIWAGVRGKESELGKVIEAAQLDKVHHLAFEIRDEVVALEKVHGSMAQDVAGLHKQVASIRALADKLDEYGDKGDLDQTRIAYASLQLALDAVKSAFPAGALGK